MSKILIVEDEEAIADLERDYLELSGFTVEVANDGDIGLQKALNEDYDLLILDLMLPGTDGFDICRQVRDVKNTPIVMVSAKKDDIDKIRGLGLGADDYMTKPFNILEVKARIKSILRRTSTVPETPKLELTARDITINIGNRSVTAHGEPVNLTVKEFDLLQLFMKNPGRVYSRDELLETIWGFDYLGDVRTVDVHIRRLREKIEQDSTKPSYIMTKWGVGYYFAKE